MIRCYLISLDELVTVPKWARRLPRVLASLPPEIIDYKGLTRNRPIMIDWLSTYDDGAPTSPGIFRTDRPIIPSRSIKTRELT